VVPVATRELGQRIEQHREHGVISQEREIVARRLAVQVALVLRRFCHHLIS
jgi:hypothetical protein